MRRGECGIDLQGTTELIDRVELMALCREGLAQSDIGIDVIRLIVDCQSIVFHSCRKVTSPSAEVTELSLGSSSTWIDLQSAAEMCLRFSVPPLRYQ